MESFPFLKFHLLQLHKEINKVSAILLRNRLNFLMLHQNFDVPKCAKLLVAVIRQIVRTGIIHIRLYISQP